MKNEKGASLLRWIVILGVIAAAAYFGAKKYGAPVAQVITSNAGEAKGKLDKARQAVEKADKAVEELNKKIKEATDK